MMFSRKDSRKSVSRAVASEAALHRYVATGRPSYVGHALRHGLAAWRLANDDDTAGLAAYTYAQALMATSENNGKTGPAKQAVALCEQILPRLDQVDQQPRERASLVRAALARAYTRLYILTLELDHARRSASISWRGMQDAPPDSLIEHMHLYNLSGSLFALAREGSEKALTDAIAVGRRLRDLPDLHPTMRVPALQNLGNALLHRAQVHGELDALEEAIGLYRENAERPELHGREHEIYLSELAAALVLHGRRMRNPASLDEAIALHDKALAGSLIPAVRWNVLSDRGLAMLERLELTPPPSFGLAEVLAAYRAAVDAAVIPVARAQAEANLAGALRRAHRDFGGGPTAIDESIEVSRRLLGEAAGSVGRRALVVRAHLLALVARGGPADRREVDALIPKAAELAPSPMHQYVCHLSEALTAAAERRWAEAADAFSRTIEQLNRMASIAGARSDVEEQLSLNSGLASDAAACALNARNPQLALTMLEHGRGIMLNHALAPRTDLARLEDADTTLHGALVECLAAAEAIGTAGAPRSARDLVVDRMDEVLAAIRGLPGFAGFWRAPSAADLLEAADAGPVVVLNPSRHRIDAIVLVDGRILTVPLQINFVEVAARAQEYMSGIDDVALRGSIGWLVDVVVGPVLEAIGQVSGQTSLSESRIWWCPVGMMSYFPLHAAAIELGAGVVSSYTSTLRSLIAARRAVGSSPINMSAPLLVGVSTRTPPLRGVLREIRAVAELLPGAEQLADPQATVAAVTERLGDASVVHLACHASAARIDPGLQVSPMIPSVLSTPGLLLHDGDLDVRTIARLRTPSPSFAFLSACSTAEPDLHMLDEQMSVAGSMQIAGYSHVVGTLWPSSDSPLLAQLFYQRLTEAGSTDFTHTAQSLHDATLKVRKKVANQPFLWAGFIHVGP